VLLAIGYFATLSLSEAPTSNCALLLQRHLSDRGVYHSRVSGNFLLSRRRIPPRDRFRNYDDWGRTDVVDVNINVQGCARRISIRSSLAAMLEVPAVESLADVACAVETGVPAVAGEAAAETGVPAMASAVETGVPAVARKAAALDAGVTTTAPALRKGLRRTI
jgi:hypothetical protein